MHRSFLAFMSGLIDYAGLFPPAELALDRALQNYFRYRDEPEAWMLGRFVCPASRLGEVSSLLGSFPEFRVESTPPLRFSVLAKGGARVADFLAALDRDLDAIAVFDSRHKYRVEIGALETRLPAEALAQEAGDSALGALLRDVETRVAKRGWSALTVFYEAPFDAEWRDSLSRVIELIGRRNPLRGLPAEVGLELQKGRAIPAAGFKVRCGGATATTLPESKQLAFVLDACRREGVSLKATAGLHHPVRTMDPHLGAKTHGFLNLFGAGLLAHSRNLDRDLILAMLEDEDAQHFTFQGDTFGWRDQTISTNEITHLRQTALTSFGSCSFEEPRYDLRALGHLASS